MSADLLFVLSALGIAELEFDTGVDSFPVGHGLVPRRRRALLTIGQVVISVLEDWVLLFSQFFPIVHFLGGRSRLHCGDL